MTDDFRSFEAVIKERAKELLELEAQQRSSQLDPAAQEQLQVLERAAANKVADSRLDGLEDTAGVRDAIEDLHRDFTAALQQSGPEQAAALDRATAAWRHRIEHAGRTRRRASWRGWGTGAAAVMLAVASAFGGTLLVRGGDDDRKSVANASQPTSPPAAPTTSPSETPATSPPEPPVTDSEPVRLPPTSATATTPGRNAQSRPAPSTVAAPRATSPASGSSTAASQPSSTAWDTMSSSAPLTSASQPPPSSAGVPGSGTPDSDEPGKSKRRGSTD